MTSLRDKLSPQEAHLIHDVPVVVGPAARSFAARLRRRFGCYYLLHGRIDERGGKHAVFARVLYPIDRGLIHLDWHTRDRTPARPKWGNLIELLTPTVEVAAEEYPLEFTAELESLVRGTAGQVALAFDDLPRAEHLLRDAVAGSGTSLSHAIDRLRADLARAVFGQGRREEGLKILRARIMNADASPYLLRTLHRLLGPQEGSFGDVDPTDRAEATAALRCAAADRADPERDVSLYNLAMLLGDTAEEEAEAREIIDDLLARSSYYRRTWYVKRVRGSFAWKDAQRALAAGEEAAARRNFSEAAAWYTRAVRARPRFAFFVPEGRRVWLVRKYDQSPILLANTHDAHRESGHKMRALWYGFRFQRLRRRFARVAAAATRDRNWTRAYAYYEWTLVGRGDLIELQNRVALSVVMRQLEMDERAEQEWGAAFAAFPPILLWRNSLAETCELPRGLPGTEPSDALGAVELLQQLGYPVPVS